MSFPFTDTYSTIAVLTAAVIVVGLGIQYLTTDKNYNPKHLPLPPGPKPMPFIGNVLDMPQDQPWLKFKEWSKQYGTSASS